MSESILNEQSVYGAYRQALAAIRSQPGSRNSRASERKQRALHVVADRYHVRVGEVKRIVRERDAAAGITHEQPKRYQNQHALEQGVLVAQKTITPGPCVLCGTEEEQLLIRPRWGWPDETGHYVIARLCLLCRGEADEEPVSLFGTDIGVATFRITVPFPELL